MHTPNSSTIYTGCHYNFRSLFASCKPQVQNPGEEIPGAKVKFSSQILRVLRTSVRPSPVRLSIDDNHDMITTTHSTHSLDMMDPLALAGLLISSESICSISKIYRYLVTKNHFFRRFKTQFLRSFPSIQSTDTDARTIFRSHVKNSKDICRKNIGLGGNSESEENQHWGSDMGFHGQSKGIQNIRCISLCVSGSAWTDFDPSALISLMPFWI